MPLLPPGGYGYDGFGLLFSATLLLAAFYYLPTEVRTFLIFLIAF